MFRWDYRLLGRLLNCWWLLAHDVATVGHTHTHTSNKQSSTIDANSSLHLQLSVNQQTANEPLRRLVIITNTYCTILYEYLLLFSLCSLRHYYNCVNKMIHYDCDIVVVVVIGCCLLSLYTMIVSYW